MRVANVVALLVCGLAVAYDAPPMMSYTKPVGDGKLVLVMLRPNGNDLQRDLRDKYRKSGLYLADDPMTPLWTCDWHVDYAANVVVTADGKYAVRVADADAGLRQWLLGMEHRPVPTVADGWQDWPVVWVYRDGRLVHTQTVRDLFNTARFTDRDLFMGPVITIDAFEEDTGRLWVSCLHECGGPQRALVDSHSGEVTDRHEGGLLDGSSGKCGNDGPPTAWWRWAIVILSGGVVVGVGAASVFVLAVVLIRRQR